MLASAQQCSCLTGSRQGTGQVTEAALGHCRAVRRSYTEHLTRPGATAKRVGMGVDEGEGRAWLRADSPAAKCHEVLFGPLAEQGRGGYSFCTRPCLVRDTSWWNRILRMSEWGPGRHRWGSAAPVKLARAL